MHRYNIIGLYITTSCPCTHQVIVVAVKNRGLQHPDGPSDLYEINKKDSEPTTTTIAHTEQFRYYTEMDTYIFLV